MADRENIGLIFVCLLIVGAFGAGGLLILQPRHPAAPPPPALVLPNFPVSGWYPDRQRFQKLNEAIDADPEDVEAYVKRARAYVSVGDLESATSDLESALEVDPSDLAALNARIEINRGRGDQQAMIDDYDTLIEVQPGRPDLLNERAWARCRAEDPDGAIEDFTRALEQKPGDPAHYQGRAWARLVKGDHSAANADYDEAIGRGGADPELYRGRGFCRLHAGEFAGAVDDFDEAVRRGVDDTSLRADRASAKLALGTVEAALADADRAVSLRRPDQERGLAVRSDVYLTLGRYDDALADLDLALASSFADGALLRRRAFVNWARGDLIAARLDAQKATELEPGDGRAALLCGVICHHEGLQEDAERHLLRAASSPAEAVRAAIYLHLARRRAGDEEAARVGLTAFAAGRARDPGSGTDTILDYLAGSIDEDVLLATAAAFSDPDVLCNACFAAGTLRLLEGDAAGAAALFDRAVAVGQHRSYEYQSARTELRRRGNSPRRRGGRGETQEGFTTETQRALRSTEGNSPRRRGGRGEENLRFQNLKSGI